jgi:hypothetical protein
VPTHAAVQILYGIFWAFCKRKIDFLQKQVRKHLFLCYTKISDYLRAKAGYLSVCAHDIRLGRTPRRNAAHRFFPFGRQLWQTM